MKTLLIIGFIWPEPTSTAAGTRMLQLIEVFKTNAYQITFACSASKTINSFNLNSLNIQTTNIQLNDSSFDSFIAELNPDLVLFDRFLTEEQFGWRVTENCSKAIRILDTEDLHFLRKARQTAYKNNTTVSLEYLTNDLTKREIASIYRCDLTLIISKYEMKLLKKTFKIDTEILQYLPFLIDTNTLKPLKEYPSFQERANFVSIGNFKHEPNWNAVLVLKNNIWPLIKQKLPNAKMLIYGAYATQKAQQLHHEKDDFLIKGWAESTEKVISNSKVCLAPLQFGAGLKGKLIDAMQFGTPSVTTTIGAEAMHKKLPWNGFICDNYEEFALKAVELYIQEKTWQGAQKNGLDILNKCFSKEKYSQKLLNKIEYLEQDKTAHRLQNFIGSLLLHHTLKSTKYMAKWIEEKNK
ncbi:MAG: glycosyltransferase [Lutibacter sp.]|uniref:glycosyltransferase n=1 Tax=Lutibacter sp. TaxID=1925666 RepID=UPI001A04A801|nr:glycosyltransferase [Lutibacter sp.]NOR28292.1 glycosyltransferase [Lutibacter sp.]